VAAIPKDDWPDGEEERDQIRSGWDEKFGDRMQQLVFIGVDMDKDKITMSLDRCLLTDAEMYLGEDKWTEFPDPFGAWQVEFAEGEPHDHDQHSAS
jgi:hypothetical protein